MSEESNFARVWNKLRELDERLKILEEQLAVKALPLKSQDITISMLKDGDNDISISLRINMIKAAQSRTKKDGSGDYHFQTLMLNDSTASIDFQLWEDDIDKYKDLRAGDIIIVKGAYIKEYNGKLQMRLSKNGTIKKAEVSIL